MNFKLTAEALNVEDSEKIMKFTIDAGFVGVPTDKTPSVGCPSGWKFMLSQDGAEEYCKSLIGMGVNCCWHSNKEFAKHDKSFKIGVVDNCYLEGNKIICTGYLWKYDFPDVCEAIKEEKELLGASVEIAAAAIEDDEQQKTRTAKGITFTGLSVVYKDKAAFHNTKFMCSIMEENNMTEQEIKDAFKAQDEAIEKKFSELSANLTDTVAKAVSDAVVGIKAELAAEAKKPEEKKEEEKKEEKAPESADLSALTKAITDGFAALKADLSAEKDADEKKKGCGGGRKTVADFSAFERYGKDKNMMELSAEIDKDDSLSAERKWATKLNLWQKAQAAGVANINL